MALANQENLEGADPHEEIVRLEEHTEELAAKIGSCRKFILAARIAVAGGAVVLAAMLVGVIRSDLGSWQRRSPYCSEVLLYGVQIVAPQKRRRRS